MMVLILCAITGLVTAVAAWLLLRPQPEKTVLRTKELAEFSGLPTPIAVILGNMTGWRFVNRARADEGLTALLRHSDSRYSAVQVRAIQVFSAMVGALIGGLFFFAAGKLFFPSFISPPMDVFFAAAMALAGGLIGFIRYPMSLKHKRKEHLRAVDSGLVEFLRRILMAVECGNTTPVAVRKAAEFIPAGPLGDELAIMLSEVRSGVSFAQAADSFTERNNTGDVRGVMETLVDMDKDGQLRTDMLVSKIREVNQRRLVDAKETSQKRQGYVVGLLVLAALPVAILPIGYAMYFPLMGGDGGGLF